MHIEKTSIPHEGNILGVSIIGDHTYLLLAHGSIQILACIAQKPTWHIKLPLDVQSFACNEHALFLGGIQYKDAQRTHSAPLILAIKNTGGLAWSHKGLFSKEEVWALLAIPNNQLIALYVCPTLEGHRFRFVCFDSNGSVLWEQILENVVLQSHYCNPKKIAPKLYLYEKTLLCAGAFCLPNATSAVSIFSFDITTGEPKQHYNAPNRGAIYTQSALSPKGHLAIAWQPFGKQTPNSGILLFDEKQQCIGEYKSYLHCWLGMTWYNKSLIISGKSRDQGDHPSLESIGKEKFFHEFKAHQLLGISLLHQNRFFYLNQSKTKNRQLILRDIHSSDPFILDEGENIGKPYHYTGRLFDVLAYNDGENHSTLLKVYPLEKQH